MFLAGDIGGTRARLSLLARTAKGPGLVRHEVFDSRAFTSLDAVVRAFLGKRPPRIEAAAFGVAGPVVRGRALITNLGWVVDSRVLSRKLRIARVTLLNDLVALAVGALVVPRSKVRALGAGGAPKRSGANVAVLAAGTGLGEAMLIWDEPKQGFVPSPTEGGHSDFAPADRLQDDLLAFLRTRFGKHVSWERILSGNGLGNVYDFFREAKGVAETKSNVAAIAGASDRNAAIAQLGTEAQSKPAARAVELFARIYGAEAGNLALKTLAVGGVYVCGNIAASMLPVLARGSFYEAFVAKGRQRALLERIPVAVVLDAGIGLTGAARVALQK